VKPYIIIYILLSLLLLACGGGRTANADGQGDTLMLQYARNLTIVDFPDYTEVTMRNPWDTTKVLGKYCLIKKEELKDKNSSVSPHTSSLIPIPLHNAAVFSSVHCALLHELAADEAVGGICDFEFFNLPYYKQAVNT
jgi:iron complex transport system substrate-binding protein